MDVCISAGYASNHQNRTRKIKRNEPGWKYAHLDSQGKPLRIPYVLQPGEISYEMYSEQQNNNRT
jgi:hypothetical protein